MRITTGINPNVYNVRRKPGSTKRQSVPARWNFQSLPPSIEIVSNPNVISIQINARILRFYFGTYVSKVSLAIIGTRITVAVTITVSVVIRMVEPVKVGSIEIRTVVGTIKMVVAGMVAVVTNKESDGT